jgi:response regulator NasT
MTTMTETRKTRLLIADDDRLVLATLADGLRAESYDVEVAASAAEALEAIAASAPDLVVLDVRMPEVDGIELARQLRQHTKVPFLFLSGYSDRELVQRAAEFGALSYLVKPLDVPQLVPAIEAALARGREIGHLREAESNLTTALSIEQRTRMAVGVLMEREHLDRKAAFDALRQRARSQRRKIADVADEIVSALETLNGMRPH